MRVVWLGLFASAVALVARCSAVEIDLFDDLEVCGVDVQEH